MFLRTDLVKRLAELGTAMEGNASVDDRRKILDEYQVKATFSCPPLPPPPQPPNPPLPSFCPPPASTPTPNPETLPYLHSSLFLLQRSLPLSTIFGLNSIRMLPHASACFRQKLHTFSFRLFNSCPHNCPLLFFGMLSFQYIDISCYSNA